jgi:hypothetical protein
MKAILLLMAMAFCCGSVWAQTDCAESQTVYDKGCQTPTTCPPSTTGTTQLTFTAACSGNYALDAWTECTGTNCGHCMSCVAVYEGNTLLATCTSNGCWADCNNTCGTVALTSGHTYTIIAHLTYCPNSDVSCEACGADASNCAAWGCLRLGTTSTCY